MIPGNRRNSGVAQDRLDRFQTGIQREFVPMAKIQHALALRDRRRAGMNQCPTTLEELVSDRLRNIQRRQIGRAERRHEQHKLQIRHTGIVDIQRLHDGAIIGGAAQPSQRLPAM